MSEESSNPIYSRYGPDHRDRSRFLEKERQVLNWVKSTVKTAIEESSVEPQKILDAVTETLHSRGEEQ